MSFAVILLVILLFALGFVAPFWWEIDEIVSKRTGSLVIGRLCGWLPLLVGLLLLGVTGPIVSLFAPNIVAFFTGGILGAGVHEWRAGTSKIDIFLGCATCAGLLVLAAVSR